MTESEMAHMSHVASYLLRPSRLNPHAAPFVPTRPRPTSHQRNATPQANSNRTLAPNRVTQQSNLRGPNRGEKTDENDSACVLVKIVTAEEARTQRKADAIREGRFIDLTNDDAPPAPTHQKQLTPNSRDRVQESRKRKRDDEEQNEPSQSEAAQELIRQEPPKEVQHCECTGCCQQSPHCSTNSAPRNKKNWPRCMAEQDFGSGSFGIPNSPGVCGRPAGDQHACGMRGPLARVEIVTCTNCAKACCTYCFSEDAGECWVRLCALFKSLMSSAHVDLLLLLLLL